MNVPNMDTKRGSGPVWYPITEVGAINGGARKSCVLLHLSASRALKDLMDGLVPRGAVTASAAPRGTCEPI